MGENILHIGIRTGCAGYAQTMFTPLFKKKMEIMVRRRKYGAATSQSQVPQWEEGQRWQGGGGKETARNVGRTKRLE